MNFGFEGYLLLVAFFGTCILIGVIGQSFKK